MPDLDKNDRICGPINPDFGYCFICGRGAPCRFDEMMPAMPRLGINEPWRFRYYLCRWCKGRDTRRFRRIFGVRRSVGSDSRNCR